MSLLNTSESVRCHAIGSGDRERALEKWKEDPGQAPARRHEDRHLGAQEGCRILAELPNRGDPHAHRAKDCTAHPTSVAGSA